MQESTLEKKLVSGVKALGGKAYKFVSPGNVGVPDRVVVLPGGHICFVELKTDTGRLSPSQKRQLQTLQELGADVLTVRGAAGVIAFLDSCRAYMEEAGHEV